MIPIPIYDIEDTDTDTWYRWYRYRYHISMIPNPILIPITIRYRYLLSTIPIPTHGIDDIDADTDDDTDTDNDEISNDTIARSIRREGLHDHCSTSLSWGRRREPYIEPYLRKYWNQHEINSIVITAPANQPLNANAWIHKGRRWSPEAF